MKIIMLYMTAPSRGEAEKISRTLLEERLIACANIFPPHTSFYWWENKIEDSEEVAVIMKAPEHNFEEIKNRVLELHSYDCPCIVALEITDGHGEFLKWVATETSG